MKNVILLATMEKYMQYIYEYICSTKMWTQKTKKYYRITGLVLIIISFKDLYADTVYCILYIVLGR